jgi:RNA polymerase sigma factor (sigma-70 family)
MESRQPLGVLLDRLCSGDLEAAEHVFQTYEPVLRIMVRRMLPARLRRRFDSADIVQSVWGDLLRGFRDAGWRFASPEHLKAFLMTATRNRYLARQRKHLTRVNRESPLETSMPLEADAPGPLEKMCAKDLWEKLLAHCPPEHRKFIELRRQGFTFQEIANQTGYHPSSVRLVLYKFIRAKQKLLAGKDFST